jgi:hypothetical protein
MDCPTCRGYLPRSCPHGSHTAVRTNVTLRVLLAEWLAGHQVEPSARASYALPASGCLVDSPVSCRALQCLLRGGAVGLGRAQPDEGRAEASAARSGPHPPTSEGAARIVAAAWADDPEWGLLVWTLMVTGARRGEVLALGEPRPRHRGPDDPAQRQRAGRHHHDHGDHNPPEPADLAGRRDCAASRRPAARAQRHAWASGIRGPGRAHRSSSEAPPGLPPIADL